MTDNQRKYKEYGDYVRLPDNVFESYDTEDYLALPDSQCPYLSFKAHRR